MKCNYTHSPWMTDDVKTRLKERSKLTEKYHQNGNMKSDLEKVIVKSNEYTEATSAAKDDYIKQMWKKPNDPLTVTKTAQSQNLSCHTTSTIWWGNKLKFFFIFSNYITMYPVANFKQFTSALTENWSEAFFSEHMWRWYLRSYWKLEL